MSQLSAEGPSAPPGRRRVRGWQISLSCLGFLSLLAGVVGGLLSFGTITLSGAGIAIGTPWLAIALSLSIPVLSIILGAWSWYARKARRLASAYAVVTGAVGLGLAGLMVLIATLTRHSGS